MADFILNDNSAEFLRAADQAVARALEIIGGKAESYAKALVAPRGPKGNPMNSDVTAQIRNSITHHVESDGGTVVIGSNLDLAA